MLTFHFILAFYVWIKCTTICLKWAQGHELHSYMYMGNVGISNFSGNWTSELRKDIMGLQFCLRWSRLLVVDLHSANLFLQLFFSFLYLGLLMSLSFSYFCPPVFLFVVIWLMEYRSGFRYSSSPSCCLDNASAALLVLPVLDSTRKSYPISFTNHFCWVGVVMRCSWRLVAVLAPHSCLY